jgi:uncharacterized protein YggU (UPF0235/DUF167 family)
VVVGADGRAALRIRLAAPPIDGAANTALIAFLAGALELPKSSIEIRAGDTSRLKMLHVLGDAREIVSRINALISL